MSKHINMKHSAENPDEPMAEYEVFQKPLELSELDKLAEREEALKTLKEALPMLYSVYGNVIKNNPPRISSKNYREISEKIDRLKSERGRFILVIGEGCTLTIHAELADQLRDLGQIEHLVLAGWKLE